MVRNKSYTVMALSALMFAAAGANAQEVAVEPAAIEALEKMSAHLRTLEQFRLIATTSHDDVIEGGQLVEVAGRTVYTVRRPDRLRVEVTTDKSERTFYYDGKTVTQFAPALGYYAVFEAGATIAETFDIADEKYDVELPLADLFYWGTDRSDIKSFTAAFASGQTRIGGETCNHYAYRSDVTDVQIWIRKYGDPLPCRLVIVTTDDAARPRYAATLEWDLDPLIGDMLFTFAPPPGAEKIDQQEITDDAK